jgi:hypothetical protein
MYHMPMRNVKASEIPFEQKAAIRFNAGIDTTEHTMTPALATTLEYLSPTPQRPHTWMYPPPAGEPVENAGFVRKPVTVHDARAGTALLEREGYTLRHAPSAVDDFLDKEQVIRCYYPEMAALALTASGASEAIVFDHLVRKRQPGTPQAFGRIEGHRPGAAGRVHCDFTVGSAQRRLQLELGERAAPVKRYAIVNLWRSIRHPVLDAPLAMCDARSVAAADLVASDIYYPDRTGEIYQLLHNPEHAWAYFPAMTRDEVLIFRQFDSATLACYTPHAAFEHPLASADTPPRESIEIRCLLIYA